MSSSKTNQSAWTNADLYLDNLFAPEDAALDLALKSSAEAGLPPHQVTPTQGKLLMLLAKFIGAEKILELGTLGGYSTIWLSKALGPKGLLVSLELTQLHADIARQNVARAKPLATIEIMRGSALESLNELHRKGRGPFDMVFIDADKPNYPEYLEWALKLTRDGSVIVADNVVRDGTLSDTSISSPGLDGVRLFLKRLAESPELESTVIQTVGSKGHDGFAIARVKKELMSHLHPPNRN